MDLGNIKEKTGKLFSKRNAMAFIAAAAFFIIACLISIVSLNKSLNENNSKKEISQENAYTFTYNSDFSKAFIKIGSAKEDITEYVTGYANGVLYISLDGICKVFSLTKEEATKEDREAYFDAASLEDMYVDETGELIKLKGEKTFIFLENSSLYLVAGRTSIMNGSAIRKDGVISMPLNYLIFDFGYNSLGVGTEGNSVIYALEK